MQLETLVREFLFECEIREYTPQTAENYKKQLRHFTEFLKEYCSVETLEAMQVSHVKAFIKHYQMRQCKPSYVDYLITSNRNQKEERRTDCHREHVAIRSLLFCTYFYLNGYTSSHATHNAFA